MTLGVSSYLWVSPFSNETLWVFDKAKKMGFSLIEIAIEDPETIDTTAIRKKADETGLDIIVCGAFGSRRDISSEDAKIRKEGLEYIEKCIDIAEQLSSPQVIGPMYSATGKARMLNDAHKARQWKWAVENLKKACAYAADRGVRLALEPLNRFETDFVNTVEQGLSLIDQVEAENLGLLLDVFHMNIEEKDSSKAIRKAGDRLYHFHVCANDRGTPGTGNIRWNDIFSALHQIDYDGPVVIESFTPEIIEIARAVSFWRQIEPDQDELAVQGLSFIKGLL